MFWDFVYSFDAGNSCTPHLYFLTMTGKEKQVFLDLLRTEIPHARLNCDKCDGSIFETTLVMIQGSTEVLCADCFNEVQERRFKFPN